jgi:hypothetical protein
MSTPHDFTTAAWRKSSRSNGEQACVEVATSGSQFAIRDSKKPLAGMLVVGQQGWRGLIEVAREA